jgi:hypothetical protein
MEIIWGKTVPFPIITIFLILPVIRSKDLGTNHQEQWTHKGNDWISMSGHIFLLNHISTHSNVCFLVMLKMSVTFIIH